MLLVILLEMKKELNVPKSLLRRAIFLNVHIGTNLAASLIFERASVYCPALSSVRQVL